MERLNENFEGIRESIREFFPEESTAILWGSAGKDFIPGVSDADILIIGPADPAMGEKLEKLHDAGGDLDVDPIYIPRDNFTEGIFRGQALGREYELHAFDLYRVKNQGIILSGDPKLLDSFPDVSLEDALADTLPHIRNVFIPRLTGRLGESQDVNGFLAENLGQVLVVVRALYTIEAGQFGSKLVALEFLKNQHPEFARLAERICKIYLKQAISAEPVQVRAIQDFLDFAGKTVDQYLAKTKKILGY